MSSVVPFKPRLKSADVTLNISISDGDRGKVENVTWTWGRMLDRLQQPTHDPYTLEQFKSLPSETQLKRKNNGYYVGAHFKHGIRKKVGMSARSLLTFDIDQGTPELLAALELGSTGMGDIEYAAYSTRQHKKDKPRIRIVIPMREPLDLDKFEPLSRIVAQMLDPAMVMVDAVSFREAQFMYWPSVCKGEDFFFLHNKGRWIEPDAMLEAFGNWQDYANLPRSDRELDLRKSETKAPDPRSKRNVVGAWCRLHDIHDTIEEHLSDVYVASEWGADGVPTRYTYTKGTTANGVVVYDDNQYIYSHHGTDPCGGKLVNAFDLRRVHEFGELDEKAPAEVADVTKLKSYEAFKKALQDDPEMVSELRQINYGDADDAWDDVEEDPTDENAEEQPRPNKKNNLKSSPPAEKDDLGANWQSGLELTGDGIIKNTLHNITLLLENAPSFKGRFAYDEFLSENVVLKNITSISLQIRALGRSEADPVGRVQKLHLTSLRAILEAPRGVKKPGWGLRITDRDLEAAHLLVSARVRVHPVRDWLETLTWDGVKRMNTLWIKACHTPDNPYFRQTAKMWLLGAVTRVYEPGHKFDFAPIIEGPQGLYKSTLIVVMGGTWAGETEGHFDDAKKFVESTQGFWIVEIPELVQFNRGEVEAIKACLSRKSDHVRLSYAEYAQTYHRQHVMCGTTNRSNYLRDQTGNRRFWPIPCGAGQIDIEWLIENREQIWAEAVHNYKRMREATPTGTLPLYLSNKEAAAYALILQGEKVVEDGSLDLAGMIERFLETPVPPALAAPGAEPGDYRADALTDDEPDKLIKRNLTCGRELWEKALGYRSQDYNQAKANAIGDAMKRIMGWEASGSVNTCGVYGRQRTYRRRRASE